MNMLSAVAFLICVIWLVFLIVKLVDASLHDKDEEE